MRPYLVAVIAVALAWWSLDAAVRFGLSVPEHRELSGIGTPGLLDYSSRRSPTFSPLTSAFIAQRFGRNIADASTTPRPVGVTSTRPSGTAAQRLTDDHPLTNDDQAQARHIPALPYTAVTDTRRATREPGESSECAPAGGGSVWYRYRAPMDLGVTANTFGSNYATALGVFGGDAGSLTRVGCDTDARGNAIVAFAAREGLTYYFQVVGPAGGGDLRFNVEPQGTTSLASASSSGEPGDGTSFEPTMSDDGRFVAFTSGARNMGCPGCFPLQTYVRDRALATTTIVSVDASGQAGNLDSVFPNISGDGRYVAFESQASNLVPGDTNGVYDIFVHDLATRRTERVSVSSSGEQLRDSSVSWPGAREPSISWDGRFVAFETRASNLVAGDTNGTWDAFVHDRSTGETERVSVNSAGEERRGPGPTSGQEAGRLTEMNPSISGNGRFVAFRSYADNLVPGDTNLNVDTFVHDRLEHTTERISVASSGEQGTDGGSSAPGHRQLSFDGRYVAFNSFASNLAPGDTGFDADAFLHDRHTRKTTRVSVSSSGEEALTTAESPSGGATISSDGRYVAFHSDAPNLVPGDDNGVVDVFVHDVQTGTTVRVSVTATGEAMEGSSSYPHLSADGTYVAFHSASLPAESFSANVFLVDQYQVYVHERRRGDR